jgi:hypothetical protein
MLDRRNDAYYSAAERERAFVQRRAKSMAIFIENLATNNLNTEYQIKPRYTLGTTFIRNLGKSGVASQYFSMLWERQRLRSRRPL